MKVIMKKYSFKIIATSFLLMMSLSCSDNFLKEGAPGAYSEAALTNLKGVEGLLISTYSALDGSYFESWNNSFFDQVGVASNWVHGSIRGGDAYKGTEPTDYVDINPVERHEEQPSSSLAFNKWRASFDGIAHANETLRVLKAATSIDATTATRIQGEARFLRGHYHFELLKTFGVPPYVDETVTSDKLPSIKNDVSIWDKVEADFQYAYDNLPASMPNVGRANKWAAASFLAKVKLYQGKFSEAKTLFDAVVASGVNSNGTKYGLFAKYSDNFNVAQETSKSPEMIFAFEASVYDGTFANGNYENTLNQPHGSSAGAAGGTPTYPEAGCCGFFQPSQSLVNAHKTTAGGLPLLTTYNSSDLKNDFGLGSSDPFTPDNVQTLDPRLDVSIGRRGLPYMDWGIHPGNNWIRQQSNGGPYSPKKNVPPKPD